MPHARPSQAQLLFPLLETLDAVAGGRARTAELYAAVAERAHVAPAVRTATETLPSAGRIHTFARSVRWAQQRGKLLGLLRPVERGVWEITAKGRRTLRASHPGVVITIFVTDQGAAVWAAAEDAIGYIDDGSVQLLLTSPPYPLIRQKAYGNAGADDYLNWFLRIAARWPQKLTPDGSIVLNLGDVWEAGRPSISLYQERLLVRLVDELGLRLCQRFAWANPAKLPAPAEWVTVRRVRVKTSLEQLYWLAPGDPYADSRQVLAPYSARMQARLAAGGEREAARPSGHAWAAGAFSRDNGGAIPGNLLQASNTSNDPYLRGCRAEGLPIHPARFPRARPDFFIRLLTRPGDLVLDRRQWSPKPPSSSAGGGSPAIGSSPMSSVHGTASPGRLWRLLPSDRESFLAAWTALGAPHMLRSSPTLVHATP